MTAEHQTVVLKVRMKQGLRRMLADRAAAQGTNASDFVRRAIVEALIANQ